MLDLVLEHGNIIILWWLTTPTILTSDLSVVKEFYTNAKLFRKTKEKTLTRIGTTNFLGHRSVLTDVGGPQWERKKRTMDPGFKISRLKDHIPKFYIIAEQVADELELTQMQDGFVDFGKIIAPYTAHAISSAGFSVTEENTLRELGDGITVLKEHWISHVAQSNPLRKTKIAAMLGLDSPTRPAAEKKLRHLREIGKRLIMDRIENGQLGKANDVLDFIIRANEENGAVSMERNLEDFMAMYGAGNSTTSSTLQFFIAEMVRNVHLLEELVREVDEIWVGRGISRNSANEEIVTALKDMEYLDAVLNETLRHHPPVTFLWKDLQQDMTISNYKIPSGTRVMVSQEVLQHHPQHWKDPNTFDPCRFLGSKEIVPYTFVPFSIGPRRCIGKNFAILEMKIFIAIWLSRMTFEKFPESKMEIETKQQVLVSVTDNRVIIQMRS